MATAFKLKCGDKFEMVRFFISMTEINLNMYKLLSVFLPLVVVAAGCANTQVPASYQKNHPDDSARIRLYGQNGKPTIMILQKESDADNKTVEVNVGGGLGDAFGSLVGGVKSESIGIAETENSKNIKDKNGILSKAFYREFLIPAGKSVQVRSSYIGMANHAPGSSFIYKEGSCSSNLVKFTPQAGKDYEVISFANGRACSVSVVEIQQQAGKTVLKSIPLE
ncbi:hypothetical protein KUF54_13225 [Comamonas sp. Y33R10-2]|uniref:hypothetical protein n=1 Tax=Comamonas sp. Y33R10-2 TaxID=2853257 RepID=UPI001C5CAD76|nr:hypothetical protein [Comamonas sp. Y33R10-2]QXZ08997.1 hypothetical protein KUF54_13225 [Comamonas sp. Y33R10-2]